MSTKAFPEQESGTTRVRERWPTQRYGSNPVLRLSFQRTLFSHTPRARKGREFHLNLLIQLMIMKLAWAT